MQRKHQFEIHTHNLTNEKMHVVMADKQGTAAVTALLVFLGLNEKADFEITTYNYEDNKQVVINGKGNVILALNLLHNQRLFNGTIGSYSHQYIVASITDSKMTVSDKEKVKPFVKEFLDGGFNLLSQESLVKTLVTKPSEMTPGDFLTHPMFQTLSLLVDDYNTRKFEHDRKGVFEKMRSTAPDKKLYHAIYAKYINFIPDVYCTMQPRKSGYGEDKVLSTTISQSRKNVVALAPAPTVTSSSSMTLAKE